MKLKFGVAAAAVLLGASVSAQAADYVKVNSVSWPSNTLTGYIYNDPDGLPPEGIGPSGINPLNVEITSFNYSLTPLDASGHDYGAPAYSLVTYCIDIAHYLTWPDVMQVVALDTSNPKYYALLSLLDNTLANHNSPSLAQSDPTKTAAIQLAAWEIMFETLGTWSVDSNSGNKGVFYSTAAPAAITLADQFLGNVSDGTWKPLGDYNLASLANVDPPLGSNHNQNQVFLVPVPEPATWGMMIAGFGLIGASLRTRRRQVEAAHA